MEHVGDGDGAESLALVGERAADVADRQVLLAEGNDAVASPVGFGSGVRPFGGDEKEGPVGILAEAMDQDAKAGRGVAEALSRLSAGETFDDMGPKGFIETVVGVGRFQEAPGQFC